MKKYGFKLALVLALFTVGLTPILAQQASAGPAYPNKMIIPGYVYPSPTDPTAVAYWNAIIAAKTETKAVILDPGNPGGPGTAVDANYTALITRLHTAGIKVLGYISSGYSTVPLFNSTWAGNLYATQDVNTQAGDWIAWYGIKDYFVDQVSSSLPGTTDELSYYTPLSNLLRLAGGTTPNFIVYNPGQVFNQEYVTATVSPNGFAQHLADTYVIFEGPYNNGTSLDYLHFIVSVPTWVWPNTTFDHFTILIYGEANSNSLGGWRTIAKYGYMTDSTTPWNALPTFFPAEKAAFDTLPV